MLTHKGISTTNLIALLALLVGLAGTWAVTQYRLTQVEYTSKDRYEHVTSRVDNNVAEIKVLKDDVQQSRLENARVQERLLNIIESLQRIEKQIERMNP